MTPRIKKAIELLGRDQGDKTYLGLCLIQEEFEANPDSFTELEKSIMPIITMIVKKTQKHFGVDDFDQDVAA